MRYFLFHPHRGTSAVAIILGCEWTDPMKRKDAGDGMDKAVSFKILRSSSSSINVGVSFGPAWTNLQPGPQPTLNDRPMKAPMSAERWSFPARREDSSGTRAVWCCGGTWPDSLPMSLPLCNKRYSERGSRNSALGQDSLCTSVQKRSYSIRKYLNLNYSN